MSLGNLDLHIQPLGLTAAWFKLEERQVAHFLPDSDPYSFHICKFHLLPMPYARHKTQDTHRYTLYQYSCPSVFEIQLLYPTIHYGEYPDMSL